MTKNLQILHKCRGFFIVSVFFQPDSSFAKKTNEPIYETPFDLAAGGASLTMAAKEGRIFANPALLPYGGRFHQWGGFSATALTSRDSVEIARSLSKSGQGQPGGSSDDRLNEYIEQATKAPIHVGLKTSLSWLTRHFAFSVFNRVEPDLKISRFGDSGLPEARFQAESYHGAALGLPLTTGWRWLSFGITLKSLMASEPDITASTIDQTSLQNLKDPDYIRANTAHNSGTGGDLGMLCFFQGHNLDFKVASKVDDIGSTQLSGDGSPSEFKQVVSAGLGMTLHTTADALHVAVDYRDILNSYEDPMYKKLYAGVRATLRTYLGLAAGVYHGHPSYGAEIDVVVARFSATYYTREMADSPGVDARNIMMFSTSLGY